jgi:peptide methionine sulfoxide reductase MsrA
MVYSKFRFSDIMRKSHLGKISLFISFILCCIQTTAALNPIPPPSSSRGIAGSDTTHSGRRSFLEKGAHLLTAATASAVATTVGFPGIAQAEDPDEIEVYFGCGCFWHVQHELVEAERRILGRKDMQLTARAGYAGGKAGSKDGKVCYHNALKISDYGSLGHAEVVSIKIPPSAFPAFAKEYFALFNEKGYRPDQWGDVGLEYRNLIGFPGGVSSPYAKQLIQVSQENDDKLDFAKGMFPTVA